MSLFQTDKQIEQFLKKVQFPDLTPQQKELDRLAIRQKFNKHRRRMKAKRYAFVAVCSAATVGLILGFINFHPHQTVTNLGQTNTIQMSIPSPIPPNMISKDADLIWQNGTATHAFVTYNGYFYISTGKLITKKSELKSELGKVTHLGDDDQPWTDFESNYFPLGTLYSINGIDPSDQIAFQFYTDAKKGASYGIFVRDTPLEKRDPQTVTSAKNNNTEISLALVNIRNQFPNFYEFQGTDGKVSEVVYEPSYGPGSRMIYQLPSGQNTTIYEYKKNLEGKDLPQSTLANTNPPPAQRTFDLNGIHWSYYNENLLRGENGDYYYEINQSGIPYDQLLNLLSLFKKG